VAMSIKVSASDFEELKPLEPGIYGPATVGKPVFHEAKSEGKYGYYEVPFSFEDKEGKPRTLTRNFSLSPKARPFIAQLLKGLGMAPKDGEDMEFEFEDLEGEVCKIAVSVRTYTNDAGEERLSNEVSKVLPA